MPTDDEVLARLRAHLTTSGKDNTCPICKTMGWDLGGLVDLPVRAAQPLGSFYPQMGQTIPAVVLVCRRCKFIRQFAWLPISGDQGNG